MNSEQMKRKKTKEQYRMRTHLIHRNFESKNGTKITRQSIPFFINWRSDHEFQPDEAQKN
jgi:isopenicillin N synthase-like dioxygenase